MTDNEIIKALECCHMDSDFPNCNECPIRNTCNNVLLIDEVFSLINRQKEEIERLEKEKESIKHCYEQAREYNNQLAESCETNCKKFNMTTRAEAIREFADRLKEKCHNYYPSIDSYCTSRRVVEVKDIDNLVKERTEVQE